MSVDGREAILMFLHRGNFSISPRCLQEHGLRRSETAGRLAISAPLSFQRVSPLYSFFRISRSHQPISIRPVRDTKFEGMS